MASTKRMRRAASRALWSLFPGGGKAISAIGVLGALLSRLALATPAEAAWYNLKWQYRKKLTIDYTKVGATQGNFPMFVSLTSDNGPAAFREVFKNTWA